jgi:arylsulfatase A-like enzyme
VPILFWRPGARPNDRSEPAETADILPTLAALIGLGVQASTIDGHCLPANGLAACPSR